MHYVEAFSEENIIYEKTKAIIFISFFLNFMFFLSSFLNLFGFFSQLEFFVG